MSALDLRLGPSGQRKLSLARGCGLLFLSSLALACGPGPSPEECGLLLDRYTEKLIDQTRPSTRQGEREDLVHRAREKAAHDPEFARCPSAISRGQFDCAMKADSADQIERCLL